MQANSKTNVPDKTTNLTGVFEVSETRHPFHVMLTALIVKTFLLKLISIIMVLPMSTAVVERGFSTMKRIKTDWRSRLETPQLSKLMYLSIEGPHVKDYDATLAIN